MAFLAQGKGEQYNQDNVEFHHHLSGCCSNDMILEVPYKFTPSPEEAMKKYPVPLDIEDDLTEWAYGAMPWNLSLRPRAPAGGCCGVHRDYDITKDMFGDPVGAVSVDYPCCPYFHGCFLMGFMGADVILAGGGEQVRGTLKRSCCFGAFGASETMEWDTATKPYMQWKRLSACDQFLYEFCCTIWTGWRGGSNLDNPGVDRGDSNWISYDMSYQHSMCDQYNLACANFYRTTGMCCAANDSAWRFGRSEDVRKLIMERYDWEMRRKSVEAEANENLTDYNMKEGNQFVRYPQPPAHDVDALYTARLYHDVKCGCAQVRWSDKIGAVNDIKSACDVRYRGSDNHNAPSQEDHLVVLAGLVLNAINTFPMREGDFPCLGYAVNVGPFGNVLRGRITRSGTQLADEANMSKVS